MDVRPLLRAAEHGDAAAVDREVGEDVHGQVEPQPRRVAAHRGRAQDEAREARRLRLQQHLLAEGLVLRVVGQRNEWQTFSPP